MGGLGFVLWWFVERFLGRGGNRCMDECLFGFCLSSDYLGAHTVPGTPCIESSAISMQKVKSGCVALYA